ncbi:hypothetical protein [Mammaliicoccus lentus]|uniref:hypothetical protein n=1 Tax=Mammaliicoccus lentus TaxID=42858 RepID=UPI001C4FDCB1|nr:hypothetical protein [Mammaliicoccus lentus]MBW0761359.1 hypothetical protein [Mammaliicoccus lentus]
MSDTCAECGNHVSLYTERHYILHDDCNKVVCQQCFKATRYYFETGEFDIEKKLGCKKEYKKVVQVGYY